MYQKSLKKYFVLCSVLIGLVLLAGTNLVLAHTDPPGSSSTGVSISLTAYRNDGATPVLPGTVTECETIKLRATLSWAGGSNAAFERGTWTIVTPDGSTTVTPAPFLPCIGGTTDDGAAPGGRGDCAPTVGAVNSALVTYTVDPTDVVGGTVSFSTALSGAYAHLGATDLPGIGGSTPFSLVVTPCDDGTYCNGPEGCDPAIVFGDLDERLGNCTAGTPVNCDDGNDCNEDSCNESTDQCDHLNLTICSEDPNVPDECEYCDPQDGECKIDLNLDPICQVQREAICRTPGYWKTHACSTGGCEEKGSEKSQNITLGVITNCGGCLEVCGEIIDDTSLNSADSVLEAMCISPSQDKNEPLQLVRQLTAMALNCCVSTFGPGCSGDAYLLDLFSDCNDTCIDDSGTRSIGQCVEEVDCFNNGGEFYVIEDFVDSTCCEDLAGSSNPGCDNTGCEASVCSYDSYCCTTDWDQYCVEEANFDPLCNYCVDAEVAHVCVTGMCPTTGAPCITNSGIPCAIVDEGTTYEDCEAIPGNCHDMEIPFEDLGLDPNKNAAGSPKACKAASKNNCLVVGTKELNCTTGYKSTGTESCNNNNTY